MLHSCCCQCCCCCHMPSNHRVQCSTTALPSLALSLSQCRQRCHTSAIPCRILHTPHSSATRPPSRLASLTALHRLASLRPCSTMSPSPLSRPCLLFALLLLSVCALTAVVTADTSCTFTVYSDSACAGRPLADTTTVSVPGSGQCFPSSDGVSSQYVNIASIVPAPNITFVYYQVSHSTGYTQTCHTDVPHSHRLLCCCRGCPVRQTSNQCAEPSTYSFRPYETVSNCTLAYITVAKQLFVPAYYAANCTTSADDDEAAELDSSRNSILALLKGKL